VWIPLVAGPLAGVFAVATFGAVAFQAQRHREHIQAPAAPGARRHGRLT